MFRNQKVIPNRIFQSLRNRLRSQPAQRSYLGALRDGDDEAAVALVDEAIRREDPKAMTTKGMMYALGRAEAHDPESAYLWFLQAANRGSPEAMVATGICYASGEGTARDLSSAAFWLHRAAKLGYPFGTGMLAWLCDHYPHLVGEHFSEDELCELLLEYARTRQMLTPVQLAQLDRLANIMPEPKEVQ